ncbi:hypothetical protein LBYZC6_17270 [Lacrimispora brassicae]
MEKYWEVMHCSIPSENEVSTFINRNHLSYFLLKLYHRMSIFAMFCAEFEMNYQEMDVIIRKKHSVSAYAKM